MKKSLTNNIGLKLLAFVIAFLLWLFVVNTDDPIIDQVYKNITVTVEHEEVITQAETKKTYQIVDNTQAVDVTVTAKRSVLNKIKAEDIVAIADMKERHLDSMVPIEVQIPGYEDSYEEVVTNPRNLQVKIEENVSKTLPITPTTTGTVRDGYFLGEVKADPEKVTLNGPESIINTITKVVAEVSVSGLSQDANLESSIILYNSDNEVIDQSRLGNNLGNIGVSVHVSLLKVKSVPVSVDTSGIVAEDGFSIADIVYEPQEIQIAGEEEVLESLSAIEIPAEAFDTEPVSKKTEMTIDIKPYLPDDVKLVDENGNNILVTVSVEKDGTKSFNLPIGSISVKNLSDSLKMSFATQDDLEVHVRGKKEVLENFSIEQAASIDLKDLDEAGEYTVPVKINLPSGCTLEGDVEIAVKLEEKQ